MVYKTQFPMSNTLIQSGLFAALAASSSDYAATMVGLGWMALSKSIGLRVTLALAGNLMALTRLLRWLAQVPDFEKREANA